MGEKTQNNHPILERALAPKLLELFQHFPVVVVSGARQVGKSTLLQHTFPHLPCVVFDPVTDIENAREDPDLFLTTRPPPLMLDEIQYAPELVPAIKRQLEKNRTPGQYLITGSQQWGVMKKLTESLAGRTIFLTLEGFSLHEISNAPANETWLARWLTHPETLATTPGERLSLPFPLYEQLWRGALPEAHFIPLKFIPDFYTAYQRTYIERDVRQMADISDLALFSRFFRLCGALTAQEINYSELGRELGLTPQTARRWLDLLQASFQWFELPAYSGNTIKRISGKPKGHLGDTGLACSVQAISTPEAIGSHPSWGNLFETAVVSNIKKQSRLLNAPPNLYHWRSHGGAEVDLLLEWNGQYYPIEIKGKSHPTKKDTRGIQAFQETYPNLSVPAGLVIAPTAVPYKLSDHIMVIPWDLR